METTSVGASASVSVPSTGGGFDQLQSEDFLQLLIQQLQFQDPLEPVTNEQLVSQISQIRDMQMNSTLTETLQSLTLQQQFGMSASLIGKYIESIPPGEGLPALRGVVSSIEYTDTGDPVLHLDTGQSVPLDKLAAVTTLERLAADLVGVTVSGALPNDSGEPTTFQGKVVSADIDGGDLKLTLDTGEVVPFKYVTSTG